MAHNTPQHTGRLIAKLRSPNSRFFVHIDRKADLSPFNYLRSHDTLFIAERESVYWADVSQIDAALKLVAAALESEPRMERFVLLSGADYPVRSRAEVEDYLLDNLTTEYMNLRRMPAPEVGKPISRLRNYRIPSGAAAWRVKLVKAGQRLDLIPREREFAKIFGDIVPFAGSQWWAVSRAAAESFDMFRTRYPQVHAYYRNTEVPDESYFHTVLGNSSFSSNVKRNLTYTDWSDGGPSPATLTAGHIDRLISEPVFRGSDPYGSGDILFARKFPDESEVLTQMLDRSHR